jgi:hypothetical protein
LVKTPNPVEGLEKAIVSRDSAGLGVSVVLVDVAEVAGWICDTVSDAPTSNATTTTPEMKRIRSFRVVVSVLVAITVDTNDRTDAPALRRLRLIVVGMPNIWVDQRCPRSFSLIQAATIHWQLEPVKP